MSGHASLVSHGCPASWSHRDAPTNARRQAQPLIPAFVTTCPGVRDTTASKSLQQHHKGCAPPSAGGASVTGRSIPRANSNRSPASLAAQSAQKDRRWTTAPLAAGISMGHSCVQDAAHTLRTLPRLPIAPTARSPPPQRRGRHGVRRRSPLRGPTPALITPMPQRSVAAHPKTRWRMHRALVRPAASKAPPPPCRAGRLGVGSWRVGRRAGVGPWSQRPLPLSVAA